MSNHASIHETARPAPAGARAPRPRRLRLTVPRLLAAGIATAAAACQFAPSGQPVGGMDGGGGNPPDARDARVAPIDADPDQPDANCNIWDFPPKHFDPCDPGKPVPGQTPLQLDLDGVYVYDTDSGELTYPSGATVTNPPVATEERGVQTIWVDGLAIESRATLRVVGSKPLMIVSNADISVRGTIDVSSKWDSEANDSDKGAGTEPSDCSTVAPRPGGDCSDGAGGGGGGGFSGGGGKGGDGAGSRDCDGQTGIPGGDGGRALTSPSSKIRGGCAGARGGNGDDDGWYGLGGAGGGAVHLVSRTRIDIEGSIHAGGAGGAGARDHRSGGGGGGSGGFIGLEAPDVEIDNTAILAANGGAGGGGTNGGPKQPGQDGQISDDAATGSSGDGGGNGGAGSAGTERNGTAGGNADRGGGGGGGGAGFIVVYHVDPTVAGGATISPPPHTRQ